MQMIAHPFPLVANILICSLLEEIPSSISHQMLMWLSHDFREQSGITDMVYVNYKKGAKNNISILEVQPLNTWPIDMLNPASHLTDLADLIYS